MREVRFGKVRRRNSWRLRAFCALVPCLAPSATAYSQESSEAYQPVRLPTQDADLEKLHAEIEQEIARLQLEAEAKLEPAATQPTELEATRSSAARDLLESLKTFHTLLKDYLSLRAQVQAMRHDQAASEMEQELAAIRARIDRVNQDLADRPPTVSEDEIRQADKEWEEANNEFAVHVAAQEERVKRLAAGTERDAATAEVQKAQTALIELAAEHEARLSSAANEAERVREMLRLRSAQVAVSLALLRVERLDQESRRDVLLGPQAERRLPLLRELVDQLQRRRDLFKQIFARNFRQEVHDWVEFGRAHPQELSPYARAHWDLCLEIVNGYDELLGLQEKAGLRDRYPEEANLQLTQALSDERGLWTTFMNSLERRPRSQIKDRYQQIGPRLRYWQSKRAELRSVADSTYEGRARVENRLDEIRDAVRSKATEIRKIPSDQAAAAKDTQLRQKMAAGLQVFENELQQIRDGLERLTERLDSALTALSAHEAELNSIRSRLYWSYLTVRDSPVWKYRDRNSVEEWRSPVAADARAEYLDTFRRSVQSVSPVQWGVMVALLIAALALAAILRIKLFRHADIWEQRVGERMREQGLTLAPVSDRIHFQGIRFLARTALLVWPCLVAWLCVRWTPLDKRVLGPALLFLILAGVAAALIRTLFPRSKIRFRVLPCSNTVAMYYRRWLFVLFWVSVILLPVPLLLTALNWAPYTRGHLWDAFKIAVMVALLLFAADRQTILKVAGRPEDISFRSIYILVYMLYPLFYLLLLALLAAQTVGYGALATYVFAGLAQSAAALFVAALLAKYVRDLAEKYRRHILESVARRKGENQEAGQESGEAASAAPREASPAAAGTLWVGAAVSLCHWGIALFTAALVLSFWGVSWLELRGWMQREILTAAQGRPAITVGRTLLALLIVVLSWVISRSIRNLLQTEVFPTYVHLDSGGRFAVSRLLHYLLVLFGLYFGLATLRIPLGALTVVLGTIGLGVGLGLQPLVLNFVSGLFMLFERHLKIGDLVEVDGEVGEVTEISMRATSIKRFDGVDMVIPNADFISKKVVNWTLRDTRLQGKLDVGVAYGTDPRLVERLLLAIASADPLVLADPPPRVRFMNFGESSLDFALYVWFESAQDRFDFLTDSRYRIIELFKENGVEMPFPQRTLSTADGQPIRVQVEQSAAPRAAAEEVSVRRAPRPVVLGESKRPASP